MVSYLDCNATTPMEPEVITVLRRFMEEEYGNSGSRTHQFGARAKKAVQTARSSVAEVVSCQPEEVVFTSGATESNNLALLGLEDFAQREGRQHIISTAIEHKAVLEPLAFLADRGFDVTFLRPNQGGWVDPDEIRDVLRPNTGIVSAMHVNNETGVIQPISEICDVMREHDAYLQVDAVQGFGKYIHELRDSRIDLISVSAHKVFGPKGVGALVARRRGFDRVPLRALQFGGGQERGIRPGTLPVPLVAGFGIAAELALRNADKREKANRAFRDRL